MKAWVTRDGCGFHFLNYPSTQVPDRVHLYYYSSTIVCGYNKQLFDDRPVSTHFIFVASFFFFFLPGFFGVDLNLSPVELGILAPESLKLDQPLFFFRMLTVQVFLRADD